MWPGGGFGDGRSLFGTLQASVREWRFLHNAAALELFEVAPEAIRGAELARDQMVEVWNKWMWQKAGREWFVVSHSGRLVKDYTVSGVFFQEGREVLVRARYELVLANVVSRSLEIMNPDGPPRVVRMEEIVRLECLSTPPQTTLRVLPMEQVNDFDIFRH